MPPWFKRFDLRQCCGSSGSFFTPMDCFVIETDACILPEWFVRILRFGPRSLMFFECVTVCKSACASICVWVLASKCVWVFLCLCLCANKCMFGGVCMFWWVSDCVLGSWVCVCGRIREPASTAKNIKKIRWKCVKEKPVYFQLAAEWFTLEPISLNPELHLINIL